MAFRLVRVTQRTNPLEPSGSAVMDFQDDSGATKSVEVDMSGTLEAIATSLADASDAVGALAVVDGLMPEPTPEPTPTTEEVETEAAELFAAAED